MHETQMCGVGDKPLGSITTWLRKVKQAATTDGALDVPCGECNRCCRSPRLFAELQNSERAAFPDAVYDDAVGWTLPKNPDGSCSRLIDGKCSIYKSRPNSCKGFDCRPMAFLKIADDNDPIMLEAVQQWAAPHMGVPEDWVILMAMKIAVENVGTPSGGWKEVVVKAIANYPRYLATAKNVRDAIKRMPEAVRLAVYRETLVEQGVSIEHVAKVDARIAELQERAK